MKKIAMMVATPLLAGAALLGTSAFSSASAAVHVACDASGCDTADYQAAGIQCDASGCDSADLAAAGVTSSGGGVSHPSAPSAPSGGGLSSVPGVPQSFAACVAFRESTDGQLSSNIYGIIPASGYNVAGASLAQQKAAFSALYAQYGTSPWAPYDGC